MYKIYICKNIQNIDFIFFDYICIQNFVMAYVICCMRYISIRIKFQDKMK